MNFKAKARYIQLGQGLKMLTVRIKRKEEGRIQFARDLNTCHWTEANVVTHILF